jgi:hypothetical protein
MHGCPMQSLPRLLTLEVSVDDVSVKLSEGPPHKPGCEGKARESHGWRRGAAPKAVAGGTKRARAAKGALFRWRTLR